MTASYTLAFSIDPATLQHFKDSGTKVVAARHGAASTTSIAWLAWDPSPSDVLSWDSTYGIFAAELDGHDGQRLRITGEVHPALDRAVYPFLGQHFGAPELSPAIPKRHYDVRNESERPVGFGLLQVGSINGSSHRSPLNVVATPSKYTADFAPLTSISVWAQRAVESGSVMTIPPDAAVFAFGDHARVLRCQYDSEIQRFVKSIEAYESRAFIPPWRIPQLDMDQVSQVVGFFCAAACAEMILSTFGYRRTDPDTTQNWLNDAINAYIDDHPESKFRIGSPEGLADALRAYVANNPPVMPTPTYTVLRTCTATESCDLIVQGLYDDGAPSATLAYNGTHWVTVFGGDGPGVPGAPGYGVDFLWVCNPADGLYSAIRGGTAKHAIEAEGFVTEHTKIADFLDTYLTPIQQDLQYDDGRNFVIVSKSTVTPRGLVLPRSDIPRSGNPYNEAAIDAEITLLLTTPLGAPQRSQTRGRSRLVTRLDKPGCYWLTPFVRDDGFADMVRVGPFGEYLGTAFKIPYISLYQDASAVELAVRILGSSLRFESSTAFSRTALVWRPCAESQTPYNPFYALASGDKTAFVSLGGRVVPNLHDLVVGYS